MKKQEKVRRTFSKEFKREKVNLLDRGKISVRELSLIYEVSPSAIYKWLRLYSKNSSEERLVVEKVSEERKNIDLRKEIGSLEKALGRKQLALDYYISIVKVASEQQGEDIIKKYKPKL